MSTIIPAGYEVRDEAGNLVAVAVRDIPLTFGGVVYSTDFVNYAGVPFASHAKWPAAIGELFRRIARGEPITSP